MAFESSLPLSLASEFFSLPQSPISDSSSLLSPASDFLSFPLSPAGHSFSLAQSHDNTFELTTLHDELEFLDNWDKLINKEEHEERNAYMKHVEEEMRLTEESLVRG